LLVRPPPAGRLEGAVDERQYEVQWRAWRRPVPVRLNNIGDVVTVLGVALQWSLQWQGWPHRVDSDREDCSRRPDVMA
jgi:hypothetical protein